MNGKLPLAIIFGMDNFLAVKLVEKLLDQGLRVYGVGDDKGKITNSNYENLFDLEKVSEKVEYFFDFGGGEDFWRKLEASKLVVVGVNERKSLSDLERVLSGVKVNYRVINLMGVYGEGMGEGWWWTDWIRQAVENENLRLPNRESEVRLMAGEDAVEAILRSCFFSGTEGESFELWGEKYKVEELAEILIDEAKMTRKKVLESEEVMKTISEEKVKEEWRKLRWQPEVEIKKGVGEVLQYFFGKIDEEKRRKVSGKTPAVKKSVSRKESEERRRAFEVVVEESFSKEEVKEESEEERPQKELIIKEEVVEVEKEEKEIVLKKEEVKEEEIEEIKPIIRNANTRKVREEVEEKEIIEEAGEDESNDYVEIEEKKEVKAEAPKKNKWELEVDFSFFKKISFKKSLLVLSVLSLFFSLGCWVWEASRVVSGIKKGGEMIMAQEYDQARTIIAREKERVVKIENRLSDIGLNSLQIGRNYQSILRVEKEVLELEEVGVESVELMDQLYKGMWPGEEVDWEELNSKLAVNMETVESRSGVLEARLGGDWSWLPGKWRTDLSRVKDEVSKARDYVSTGRKVLEIWPEIIAVDGGRKEYLVLFQNENEIRATGGFIGSYGILSFEGGVLDKFEINDIYEIDGQLKGHVEPPEEIKNILGEASYYMRDANWNPDFTKAAKDLEWFFDKEAGRKVDGVIGINLAVAKELVGIVGEVSVPDFGEKITKENLYEQAEFYSETKFFPGSNQKASFLGGLGKQLFEEIKHLDSKKRVALAGVVIDLLDKNEIQVALHHKDSARVMAELGWDGAIWEGECAGERCVADYTFIVESNLGVNKANYFISRNVEQQVDLGVNSINRRLKINYENTAKNTSWPGGDYKNYLRIYLPKDVNLAEVSVSKSGGEGKKIYSSSELKVKEVGGKKEIGFLMTVPILEKREVEIKYSSAVKIGEGEKFSYLNYIQKQSGFGDVAWVSLVSVPTDWQILQVEPVATVVGGKLLFNQKLDRDLKMGVEIGK